MVNESYNWMCYNNCGVGFVYVNSCLKVVGVGHIYNTTEILGKELNLPNVNDNELQQLKDSIKRTINRNASNPTQFFEIEN